MEGTLLPRRRIENSGVVSEDGRFLEQLKQVSFMAAPMEAVTVAQYLLQFVSLMMVGHLGGEVSLCGVALGTTFANVTGFRVILGMSGALETLCDQTFGAEQFHKVGSYAFCAIISLVLVCIPISLLYLFMDQILIFFGQDPSISMVAGKYFIWLIFALFGYAVLQALTRYFQTQTLFFPMIYSSTLVLVLHIPICWALAFKLRLEENGAALAIGISYWLNVILLIVYMKYSQACKKTPIVFSMDALLHIQEFFCLAIRSTPMVGMVVFFLLILIINTGHFPNSELKTSALAICYNMLPLHSNISFGIGAAASTRVSNELGAGRLQAARGAVHSVIAIGITEAIVVCFAMFSFRHILGYAFSDLKEVVDYVADISPLLCLSIGVDSMRVILSGITKGALQEIAFYYFLAGYDFLGVLLAHYIAVTLPLGWKGFWIETLTWASASTFLHGLKIAHADWDEQAALARKRIFDNAIQLHNRLL